MEENESTKAITPTTNRNKNSMAPTNQNLNDTSLASLEKAIEEAPIREPEHWEEEEGAKDVQSIIAQSALQKMPDQELLDMLLAGQSTCEDEVFSFLLERCLTISPKLKSVAGLGAKLEEQLRSVSNELATLRVESSAYAKDMVNRYRKVTKTDE